MLINEFVNVDFCFGEKARTKNTLRQHLKLALLGSEGRKGKEFKCNSSLNEFGICWNRVNDLLWPDTGKLILFSISIVFDQLLVKYFGNKPFNAIILCLWQRIQSTECLF